MKDDKELIDHICRLGNMQPNAAHMVLDDIRAHDAQPEYGEAILTHGTDVPENAKVEAEGRDFTVYRLPVGPTVVGWTCPRSGHFADIDRAIANSFGHPVYELIRGKQVHP